MYMYQSRGVLVMLLQVALPEDTTGAQRFTKRDASLALRPAEAGVVDQVWLFGWGGGAGGTRAGALGADFELASKLSSRTGNVEGNEFFSHPSLGAVDVCRDKDGGAMSWALRGGFQPYAGSQASAMQGVF